MAEGFGEALKPARQNRNVRKNDAPHGWVLHTVGRNVPAGFRMMCKTGCFHHYLPRMNRNAPPRTWLLSLKNLTTHTHNSSIPLTGTNRFTSTTCQTDDDPVYQVYLTRKPGNDVVDKDRDVSFFFLGLEHEPEEEKAAVQFLAKGLQILGSVAGVFHNGFEGLFIIAG